MAESETKSPRLVETDNMAVVSNSTERRSVDNMGNFEIDRNNVGKPMIDPFPKKKSAFQITSVGIRTSIDQLKEEADADSMDDLDDTHTEDVSSEVFDCSKFTDMEPDPSSVEDTCSTVASAEDIQNIIKPCPSDHQSRFRVVKIESKSKEPYRRGRWTCCDYSDPPSEKSFEGRPEGDKDVAGSGNSSAASSIHYVPGVDDPSKNPLNTAALTTPILVDSENQQILIVPQPNIPNGQVTQANDYIATQPATGEFTPSDFPPPQSHDYNQQLQASTPHSIDYKPVITEYNHQSNLGSNINDNMIDTKVEISDATVFNDVGNNSDSVIKTSIATGSNSTTVVSTMSDSYHRPRISSEVSDTNQHAPLPNTVVNSSQSAQQSAQLPSGVLENGAKTSESRSHVLPNDVAQSGIPDNNQTHLAGSQSQPAMASVGAHGTTSNPPGQSVSVTLPTGQSQSLHNAGNGSYSSQKPVISSSSTNQVVGQSGITQNQQQPPTSLHLTVDTKDTEDNNSNKDTQLNLPGSVQLQLPGDTGTSNTTETGRDDDTSKTRAMGVTPQLFESMVGGIPDALASPKKEGADGEESGSSTVAIDNKIEQAMDLVKSHLMFAVREEVEVLKEQIKELLDQNNQLEYENNILKTAASSETLNKLAQPKPPQTPSTTSS